MSLADGQGFQDEGQVGRVQRPQTDVQGHLVLAMRDATNIAEDVIFVVEAKDVRHHHEDRMLW